MAHVRTGKARALLRSSPSGSFDQYLLDIQKLPMITDPEEEKRLNEQDYQDKLARALLEGIRDFVAKHPPRPSPVALN